MSLPHSHIPRPISAEADGAQSLQPVRRELNLLHLWLEWGLGRRAACVGGMVASDFDGLVLVPGLAYIPAAAADDKARLGAARETGLIWIRRSLVMLLVLLIVDQA